MKTFPTILMLGAIMAATIGYIAGTLVSDHLRLVQVRQLLKDEGHPIQMDQ